MTVIQREDEDRARSLEIEREGLQKTEQGKSCPWKLRICSMPRLIALVVRAAAIFAATCLASRTGVVRVQAPVVFASRSGSLSG